jgi:hypothetical protein
MNWIEAVLVGGLAEFGRDGDCAGCSEPRKEDRERKRD